MPAGPRWKPRDAGLPHLDGAPPADVQRRQTACAAAPELVGLHGHLDAARATL
jgi:hypothetical protein